MEMINKGDFNYFENKNYSNDLKDLKEMLIMFCNLIIK